MTAATSNTSRIALTSITESDLNISRNNSSLRTPKLIRSGSFLQSTPIKAAKRPFANLDLEDSQAYHRNRLGGHRFNTNNKSDPYDIGETVSPRLKKARLIKMKLQVAWYKVKTNQTTTPVNELKFPLSEGNDIPNLISPITKKSMLEMAASKLHKLPTKNGSLTSVNEKFNFSRSKMDDIVFRRSSNSQENKNVLNNFGLKATLPLSGSVPSSAPASITTFAKSNLFSKDCTAGSSELTARSLHTRDTIKNKEFKLPPISKILMKEDHTKGLDQINEISSSGQLAKSNILTSSVTDKDLTIEQVSTPVKINKEASQQFKADDRFNAKVLLKEEDLEEEVTQTQLWSSPGEIQTTPSSIGAARCLLQLAHR